MNIHMTTYMNKNNYIKSGMNPIKGGHQRQESNSQQIQIFTILK